MRQSKRTGWGGPREGAGQPKKEPTTVVRLPVEIADMARRMAARGGSSSGIGAFLNVEARTAGAVPFVAGSVACGFPSPAEADLENPLDFNELMSAHLPSVFAVRVTGESMIEAGLFPGDIAVVDKAAPVRSGCVIVACLNGEFTLKRYILKGEQVILRPENEAFSDIPVSPKAEFEIWGVVIRSVRMF